MLALMMARLVSNSFSSRPPSARRRWDCGRPPTLRTAFRVGPGPSRPELDIDWLAKPAMAFLLNYDSSRANLALVDKIADLRSRRCRTRAACLSISEIEHCTIA